jgi:hypothetical protein
VKAAVLGLGIVSPGAAGCEAFLAGLSRGAVEPLKIQKYGDDADPRAKRLPRLDRMALAAGREALGDAPREQLAVVFGTGYGGLAATVDFLEGVAVRGNAFGSPTAFHQSVHHAPLGQLSIALQIRGACLTASDRELSGESALKVGLDLLAGGRAERVLVVAADETVPALLSAYAAFGILAQAPGGRGVRPAEGAAAVLLGRAESAALFLEHVEIAGHPGPSLRLPSREAMAPLLARAAALAGPAPLLSPAACGLPSDDDELTALRQHLPDAELLKLEGALGFNPSGGLLRLVACALRLRADAREGRAAIVHGLAPGGGQAVSVLRHGRS